MMWECKDIWKYRNNSMIYSKIMMQVPLNNGTIYNIEVSNRISTIDMLLKEPKEEFEVRECDLTEFGETLTLIVRHDLFSIEYDIRCYNTYVTIEFELDKLKDNKISIIIDNETYKIYDLIRGACVLCDDSYELKNNVYVNLNEYNIFEIYFEMNGGDERCINSKDNDDDEAYD